MRLAPSLLLAVSSALPIGCGPGTPKPVGRERPVPVQTVAVVREDVPVYLDGLGTVVANQTVTVKTLVDGRLDRVYFKEGQVVKKGELLAQIDPRPFEIQRRQGEAALARDRAQLHDAKQNLARYQVLVKTNLVPIQQIDDQAALVGQLDGTVRGDQATIDAAKLQLDYARIRSPLTGVTGVRLVDAGNVVHQTDPGGLVIVTELDPAAILFTLPEDDLARVERHLARGSLAVEARSRDGAELLGRGWLSLIDNQINQTTATLRLKAIVPNPDRLLWPNQFVKARLQVETRKDALVIPQVAIQRGPDGTFVYLVAGDGRAALRKVAVLFSEGDEAVVEGAIAVGDTVVVEGQNQLKPGARVAPRPLAPPGETARALGGSTRAVAPGAPR